MAHAELLYMRELPVLFPKAWYARQDAPPLLEVHLIPDMRRQSLHQDFYKSFRYDHQLLL